MDVVRYLLDSIPIDLSMKHIMDNSQFLERLAEIAQSTGEDFDIVQSKATKYLKELKTEQNPYASLISSRIIEQLMALAYEETIDVDPDEIKKLSKIMLHNSVAFVMTHKTYIDMFVLGIALLRHGLPWPIIFAGANLSFPGFAQLGRKIGLIFIRRSFKDNLIYKLTLKYYIASLVDDRQHFMWSIEGTRSRTGKLVWPKMGILKYIADAEQESTENVKYVPVSVVYDLIPDVQDMTAEGRGKEKKSENLAWMMNYIRNLNKNYGKISLRFGEPVEKNQEAVATIPTLDSAVSDQKYTLPRFAFELVHAINRITPVTTASLICTTLLSKFALTKTQICNDVVALMELIEDRKGDALVDRGAPIGDSVQCAINLLKRANIIKQVGDGVKAKYTIVTSSYLPATYYSNMSVHHFYHRAFIELALIKTHDKKPAERTIAFWQEIMSLRNVFKFEFFYSNKAHFSDEIEDGLSFLHDDWKSLLVGKSGSIEDLLKEQKIFVSHVALFTIVEAYRVVLHTIYQWDDNDIYNKKHFLDQCLFTGEEMHWQGSIHRVESVSKPFLINAIRLCENLKLIPIPKKGERQKVHQMMSDMEDIANRISTLQGFILNRSEQQKLALPIDRSVVPGSKTASITAPVIDAESGPHIGAFFDLDRTLIKGFSAKQFFQSRLLSGQMSSREITAQFNGVMVYATGNKNFAGLAAIGAMGVKGVREQIFINVGEEVYEKYLAQAIYPESRALVAAHLAKGHTVAIISAATPYQVNPIARDLSVEHVICTRMEVKDGKFTGEIVEPACWGDGKAKAALALAEEKDLDLSKSYFYTDSVSDLPLLELVGKPQPTNPDQELSAISFKNDWPIYRFDDVLRPGVENVIRTMLAASSLIPAAIAGMASGLLSGSRRDGVNSMTAVIGDLGTTVAGMKLAVKGKENLWRQRPAVFLFNHQSNADFLIMAKLVRKNTVAIAKKELKYTPVGPLFQAAGVVFIDRKNRDKAIEALKPVIDVLNNGTSVAIAPEGTRSYDYQLGPFKKGAFHLAMKAKVPIIPICIMNAHDVMPRGSKFINPTVVTVKVLDPISVEGWTKANMDAKIEEVRNLYLRELGQFELSNPEKMLT
jgi:putative phosphoserine phosphatase/1-acylglycerol-3-phosphate O-acyltransferase